MIGPGAAAASSSQCLSCLHFSGHETEEVTDSKSGLEYAPLVVATRGLSVALEHTRRAHKSRGANAEASSRLERLKNNVRHTFKC